MNYLLRLTAPIAFSLTLAACSQDGSGPLGGPFSGPFSGAGSKPEAVDQPIEEVLVEDAAEAPEVVETTTIGAGGNTADALDTTSEAEKEAAVAAPAPTSGLIGETVASLGDPTQQGFWLKTPLVTKEAEGTVERTGGATVNVTLIPLGGDSGGGSQISLAAMRALDIGLTDLETLKVYLD